VNAQHLKTLAFAGPAAAALLALTACAGVSTRSSAPAVQSAPTLERVSVYVVKRGWHIDIGIARADALAPLQPVAAMFPQAQYLLFGFGERHYLLNGGAANALGALWGGAGLVMLTSIAAQPLEQVFGADSVIRLAVTLQQMSALQAFIGHTFALRAGAVVPVPAGPHAVVSYSAFYESTARYSARHTCNTWAAEALQAAQLPVSSSGVEFSGQLWRQVRSALRDATQGARINTESPSLAVM
jgi:uncharacterized protein (TIGR02117 family)